MSFSKESKFLRQAKFLTVIFVVFLISGVVLGQQNESSSLTRYEKDEKWGFLDKSGAFVIAPQFDWVSDFSEDLAAVMVGNKYGFINETGAIVIKPLYTDFGDFSEGLARVKVGGVTVSRTGSTIRKHSDNNWRYIDKFGNTVFKFRADSVGDFSEGVASACIIKGDGYLYCGYIDKQGQWVIEPQFGSCEPFSNGIATVLLNGKWRQIDQQGKFIDR